MPAPTAATVDVIASGKANGTFKAVLLAVWNKPSAQGLTKFTLIGKPDKAVGVNTFALDATIVDLPKKDKTYDERAAQISASMELASGSLLDSNINSKNTIYITEVGALVGNDDGSAGVPLHGKVEGSVLSVDNGDFVQFYSQF